MAQEAAAQATADIEQKTRLLEIPATRETVFHLPEGKETIRKVAPPPTPPLPPEATEIIVTPSQASTLEVRTEKNLTLLVTTADERSEIRAVGDPGSVIAPISLRHLPAFFTLETPEKRIHFFSILQTSENPPHSPDDVSPSTATRESIDLLLQHYDENRTRYETQAHEAAQLQAARVRYSQENSSSEAITLNVWRYRRDETP